MVTTPITPQVLTPEQQAQCQQAYDQGTAALQLSYQSQYAQTKAGGQQKIANDSVGAPSPGMSQAIEADVALTNDELAALTAQYNLNTGNEQRTLQECLNP